MSSPCGNCASPTHDRPFCAECGHPTDAVAIALDDQPTVVERSDRGRKALTAVAVVGALALGAAFLFGGGDDADDAVTDSTTTTTSTVASTTTTTTIDDDASDRTTVRSTQDTPPPELPEIERALDAYVIAVDDTTLRRTDLDTGEIVEFELDRQRQRTLHIVGDEVALLEVNVGQLHEVVIEPFGLGRTELLSPGSFPQSGGGSALAFQGQGGEVGDFDGTSYQIFRSFDLPMEEVSFPSDFFVFSVVPAGDRIVLNSVVGSLVWDGARVEETVDGFVLATTDDRALWYGCDETLDCGVYLGTLGDPGARLDMADEVVSPFAFGFGSTSQVGDLVLSVGFSNPTATTPDGVLDVVVINLADGTTASHDLELRSANPTDPFSWQLLPDGSGLVNRQDIFDFECSCTVPYSDGPFGSQNFGQIGLVAVAKP